MACASSLKIVPYTLKTVDEIQYSGGLLVYGGCGLLVVHLAYSKPSVAVL